MGLDSMWLGIFYASAATYYRFLLFFTWTAFPVFPASIALVAEWAGSLVRSYPMGGILKPYGVTCRYAF